MANTIRAPRNLKPEDTIAAETAAAEQKAAREANSASLTKAVQDVIGEYYAAEQTVTKAQSALATKLEGAYVALAKLANDNEMSPAMCKEVLTTAIEHFYGKGSTSIGLSTATKLRSQLLRAMHPNVRGNLPEIVKAWDDAWNRETKAKASDPKAATPLRDKFDNRGNTITQALTLAQGKDKGKDKAPSLVVTDPAAVLTWVKEHPRQARGASTPVAKTDGTVTGDARTQAIARVEHIVALVKALQDDYPVALDTIQPVLDALVKVTGARLVPSKTPSTLASVASAVATSAAQATPAAAPEAAEPVEGPTDLDAVLDAKLEAALSRMMAKMGK